ncbi:MAG: cysteine hydrolase [Pseudorhodoplanes sp.]|nr:cysteine hydrolase [Pseudorhodoplanes sp.]
MKRLWLFAGAFAASVALAGPARAQSVIDEWAGVQAPPSPPLKPVTVDPKTTALLMLDFMNQNCGRRPRCVASLPAVKKLLAAARASKAPVVYSLIANTTAADVMADVAPATGEPSVLSGPNKFLRTELDRILKDRGVQTVIVVGTAAHGAVLNTASHAAFTGYGVIVPVDGMSADPYAEQYVAWHLVNAPGVSARTTLTRSDMIRF